MLRPTFCLLAAFFALTITTNLSAQTPAKFGHMNLGNLLESLPEVKTANDTLEVFAQKYGIQDDTLNARFERAYVDFERRYQAGDYTPVVAQQKYQELEQMRAQIEKFEQDAEGAVTQKRDELLAPILNRVNEAIKAVGKENNYAMIFDISSGAALYAASTDDVTPLVRKKLGVQ
jgi:outer membrane protein